MESGVFYFDSLIEKNGTFLDIYMHGSLIVNNGGLNLGDFVNSISQWFCDKE